MELDPRRRKVFAISLLAMCAISLTSLGFSLIKLFANRELADLNLQQSTSLALQVGASILIVGGSIYMANLLLKRR